MVHVDQGRQPNENATVVFALYRCPHCESQIVGVDFDGDNPPCHDQPMARIWTPGCPVTRAGLGSFLADAVGIPRAGTDTCYALYDDGLCSVAATADRDDRRPDTVRRQLERLVAAGYLARTELGREGNGVVNLYHAPSNGPGQPRTLAEFCRWATVAVGDESPVVTSRQDLVERFRDRFDPG